MSTPRAVSKENVLAAEANPQLQRLVAAMERPVLSEEDRKLLLGRWLVARGSMRRCKNLRQRYVM
jgi:hypothetical protein